eukprot:CAMPEP_0197461290 /NCGR_PEP_ID=MMETSP1175-20131217/56090_1 /TAXON_ID=1003142 /ORGANISM="Triceratium dubium, Strain CCMP147" /LENGTH=40 /DNA_ID= /DNA_START= /DNA_END= /DNA_ORIENTATION=
MPKNAMISSEMKDTAATRIARTAAERADLPAALPADTAMA